MASDRGEDMSFSESEFDAEGLSEFCKFFEEEGEINIRESDRGVVDNGSGVRLGTKEIVVRLLVVKEAELRAFKE